ncbi:probable RNA-binding protein CG14230 [Topomyia yanbarensis]|uniref:probable RNA-binding protein CG14230 n=1 Tax=Topomyia yanbarensis TaxID=2498891 RepID=UPI00273AE934|nr:probable RNA-binding protein CG14230 [Topomyia yanbarensis]
MPLQRLFVGNIPAGTSEQELKQEFSAYGPVKAIDLKCKPNPLNDSVDTFAFVNIELDDRAVGRCITEFRQEQYKGVFLNVSKAKESFLDRLKREREEAEAGKLSSERLNPYKKCDTSAAVRKDDLVEPLPVLPTIQKEVESSSSGSSSESEDDGPEPAKTSVVRKPKAKEDDDQLVRKWNQETFIEHGKLKIVPITGQVKEVIDKSKNRKKQEKDLDEKARLADEKRKQGLSNLQSAYEQQKQAIQKALAGGEASKRKKIVFDDDSEEPARKHSKVALFNDEDEEDGFKANFAVRKQLAENTEKGQRLFEMQTQFHGDSRFKLDERFLADDSTEVRKSGNGILDRSGAKSGNHERKKQLEILSKVTGKEIHDRSQFSRDESGRKVMQRFDPSTNESKVSERPSRKEKQPTDEDLIEAKKAVRPAEDYKVSEDTFYSVSDSITQVIGNASGEFSLLSMFGNAAAADDDGEDVERENQDLGKPVFSDARFKYESSASEDEEGPQEKAAGDSEPKLQIQEAELEVKKQKKKAGYFSKQGVWKENFFFLPKDPRFEEGRKLFFEFASKVADAAVGRDEQRKDIRKIFKKRRLRETKNVNQMRVKRGLKLVKNKRR